MILIFVFGINNSCIFLEIRTILATLQRKAGGEFCRFWDKLELDTTELDVNEPVLLQESKSTAHFCVPTQSHQRQYAYRFYSLTLMIGSSMQSKKHPVCICIAMLSKYTTSDQLSC